MRIDNLPKNIKEKLDTYNQKRIIYFYNNGDEDCNQKDTFKPLSLESIKRLDEFLSHNIKFPKNEPSVFMNYDGSLIIEYDKSDGSAVILEFIEDRLEYYIEDIDEEKEISYNECEKLIKKL